MNPDPLLTLLVAAVFVLLVLTIIIRNLRMPASFLENQRERGELKKKFLKRPVLL